MWHPDSNRTPNNIFQYERIEDIREGVRRRIPYQYSDLEEVPLESVEVTEPIANLVETSFSVPSASTASVALGVSELTPLVAAAPSAAIGGVSSAAAGVGALAVLGTGVIAGIASRVQNKGAVLPGHHYIGPGNPLNGQVPVDTDDQIAKKHDEAYERAKTAEDVRKADSEAVSEFTKDCLSGNIHSCAGAVGLGVKQLVEKHTGVIYPSVAG